MIEINLLPSKVQKAKGVQQFYVLVGVGAVVVYAVLGFLYFTTRQEAGNLRRQIEEVRVKQEKLRPIITKIERIRAEEQLRNDKLAVIKGLLDKQVFWLRVAQDLSDAVPASAWLTSVRSIGPAGKLAGTELELQGNATSHASLAEFVQNLQQKSGFGAVAITGAREAQTFGYKLVRFTVSLKVTLAG